jgi:hypothetical protein
MLGVVREGLMPLWPLPPYRPCSSVRRMRSPGRSVHRTALPLSGGGLVWWWSTIAAHWSSVSGKGLPANGWARIAAPANRGSSAQLLTGDGVVQEEVSEAQRHAHPYGVSVLLTGPVGVDIATKDVLHRSRDGAEPDHPAVLSR